MRTLKPISRDSTGARPEAPQVKPRRNLQLLLTSRTKQVTIRNLLAVVRNILASQLDMLLQRLTIADLQPPAHLHLRQTIRTMWQLQVPTPPIPAPIPHTRPAQAPMSRHMATKGFLEPPMLTLDALAVQLTIPEPATKPRPMRLRPPNKGITATVPETIIWFGNLLRLADKLVPAITSLPMVEVSSIF